MASHTLLQPVGMSSNMHAAMPTLSGCSLKAPSLSSCDALTVFLWSCVERGTTGEAAAATCKQWRRGGAHRCIVCTHVP